MKSGRALISVCLAALATSVVGVPVALAGGGFAGPMGGGAHIGAPSRVGGGPGFAHRPEFQHPGFRRPGFGKPGFGRPGFGKPGFARPGFHHRPFRHHFGSSAVVWAVPGFYYGGAFGYGLAGFYDSPGYYDPSVGYGYGPPPVIYGQPAGMGLTVAPAPPPPQPGVIEYPTGRYELQGDGVRTPYRWVWISAIPEPPPPPPSGPPSGAAAAPARKSRLYRWTDEQGVMHLTDNWEAVPEQYRPQAKRGQPS